jgi:hypothetical protein
LLAPVTRAMVERVAIDVVLMLVGMIVSDFRTIFELEQQKHLAGSWNSVGSGSYISLQGFGDKR